MKLFGRFFYSAKNSRKYNSILWGTRLLQILRIIREMRSQKQFWFLNLFLSLSGKICFLSLSPKFQTFTMICLDIISFFSYHFCGPFESRKSSPLVWKYFLNYFVNDFFDWFISGTYIFCLIFYTYVLQNFVSISFFAFPMIWWIYGISYRSFYCKLMDMKECVQIGKVLRIQEIQFSFFLMFVPFTQTQINGVLTTERIPSNLQLMDSYNY